MKNELYSFATVKTACALVGPRSRAASVSCGLKGHPNGAKGNALGDRNQPSFSFLSAARRASSEHLSRTIGNPAPTIETAIRFRPQSKILPHSGRALAPSHFPQFPLNTQNAQKNPYSRAFCGPNAAIPTPFPTFFHSVKTFKTPVFARVFTTKLTAISTFFTFSTQHKKSGKTSRIPWCSAPRMYPISTPFPKRVPLPYASNRWQSARTTNFLGQTSGK